ncbi:MAG: hypothetical protein U0U66_05215 [Cytophagaceae bacterium]
MYFKFSILFCSLFVIGCNDEKQQIIKGDNSLLLKEFAQDIIHNKSDDYLYETYFDDQNEQFRTFLTIRKSVSDARFQNIKTIIKTDSFSLIPYKEASKIHSLASCNSNQLDVYILTYKNIDAIYYIKFKENKIWSCSPIINNGVIIGWDKW